MLYFFLSYARGDEDVYVERFYQELCAELRTLTGERGGDEQIGFFDSSSIDIGQDWSAKLVDALSTCRTLLFLCTPAAFRSRHCGKEFQVFADRLALYQQATGIEPPAVLPLLWNAMPEDGMHPVMARLQHHNASFGEDYRTGGIRQLIRLNRNHDAYLEFLEALARKIAWAAQEHVIPKPEVPPSYHETPSGFHDDEETGDGVRRPLSLPASQHVHFVIAAPSKTEASGVRRESMFYGEQSVDWSPYQPHFPYPLAPYAVGIAAGRSFQAEVATVDGLLERIEKAAVHNEIVILVVDAWVTLIAEYREALAEYGEREHLHYTTAVMIPSNASDDETRENRGDLARRVRSLFYRRAANDDDLMYRASILSHEAFDADLRVLLEVAKNQMFARGKVYRRPDGDDPGERPILEGP